MRFARSASALALAVYGFVSAAQADTDPGYLLTATSKDLPAYFPSYLANGYVSTMTAPRGTENTLSKSRTADA